MSALSSNTTGHSNSAMGQNAGQAITDGTHNTAVGREALLSLTTHSYNTAVGSQALNALTTAHANTAVGYQAMVSATTGGNNTVVGYQAAQANTTGYSNVAVGVSAAYATTTAIENVVIGDDTGKHITTGSYNVIIGRTSCSYNTNLTTGDKNVVIGSYNYTTSADTDQAIILGHGVGGAQNYTTLGHSTSDIRAEHGVATWATVSDERVKKDITDSTAGLSFVNALKPRTFKYKNLGELPNTFNSYKEGSTEVFKNSNTNHGFIAQEVKAAINADSSIKDGFKMWDDREDGSQEVAEAALIPVLVKAIQELSAKNEALVARVTTLEG